MRTTTILIALLLTQAATATEKITGYDQHGKQVACQPHAVAEGETIAYKKSVKKCLKSKWTVIFCEDGRQLCSKPPDN
jgi:hypothetical protein